MNALATQSVENLKGFLGRFAEFKQNESQALVGIKQFLDKFEIALPGLQRKEKAWELETAPHFNIFRVLSIERREVKLHSRFLAELLDPCGSHSQQDHFLNLFFEVAGLPWPCKPTKPSDWRITVEESAVKFGRLDIVLRANGFILAIENKIDANEQEEQMARYKEWLDLQKLEFPKQILIFLTPDGRPPNTISEGECLCLSYSEHIQAWLESIVNDVENRIQAPALNSAIKQYLQIIKSL
jgi:PD-(D/E)XK nuclease superfamily